MTNRMMHRLIGLQMMTASLVFGLWMMKLGGGIGPVGDLTAILLLASLVSFFSPEIGKGIEYLIGDTDD